MSKEEKIIEEIRKCRESPYYFATTYLQIDGKPFTTGLTEEEFNTKFNSLINNPFIKNRNHG